MIALHGQRVRLTLLLDTDRYDDRLATARRRDATGVQAVRPTVVRLRSRLHRSSSTGRHRHSVRTQDQRIRRSRSTRTIGVRRRQVQRDGLVAEVPIGHRLGDRLVVGVREGRQTEGHTALRSNHRLLDRRRQIDPPSTLLERGLPVDHLGRTHQRALQLTGLPRRVLLHQQRRGAGGVRSRHRRTVELQVLVTNRRADTRVLRLRRNDSDAGRRHVGLQRTVTDPRSGAGEPGQLVLLVDRADRQSGVGTTRRLNSSRRGPTVAGGNDKERAGLCGQPVHGLLDRVDLRRVLTADAEVDDVGLDLLGRPLHSGQHVGLVAALLDADLAVVELRVRCHTLVLTARRSTGSGDRRGDVRPVTDHVLGRLGGEVLRARDLRREVRMRRVDSGVEYGDRHALTGVAGLPRVRSADLRHRLVQRDLALAVQPHLGDPSGGSGRRLAEEVGGLRLVHVQRRALDRRQLPRHLRSGRRAPLGRLAVVRRQHRNHLRRRVVVPGLDQRGDVEQPPVQPSLTDRLDLVGRDHVRVVLHPLDPETDALTAGTGLHRLLRRVTAVQHDAVTGDQRDLHIFSTERGLYGGRRRCHCLRAHTGQRKTRDRQYGDRGPRSRTPSHDGSSPGFG